MQKFIAIGNLTRDPQFSEVGQESLSNCKFSIAVGRKYKRDEVDYFNVVTWRATADNCAKYLKKGSKVAISGELQNNNYEKDGVKHYSMIIVADEVQFLSTKNEQEQPAMELAPMNDGLLPF